LYLKARTQVNQEFPDFGIFCYNFNFDLSCIEVKYYTLGDTKINAPPV